MKISSLFVLRFCLIFVFLVGLFYYPRWNQKGGQLAISSDVAGYYLYLPATFIYNDLRHCEFRDSIVNKKYNLDNFEDFEIEHKEKFYVIKYSSGQAIAMSPFFFLAHWYTINFTHYPADGFSYPYQLAIGMGMLIYAFIGLYYLRKVLLIYFSDSVVSLSILTIVLGTNYLNYAAIDTGMTHSTLFAIYSILMYQSIIFYQRKSLANALFIGFLVGFATLIRPTECISILIPILWNLNSFNEFKERLILFRKNPKIWLSILMSAFLVVSIQLIYWKWLSGNWFVYSYKDQGFSWLGPHFYEFALEYRCGWLRLTPVMIFAFIGIPFLIKSRINRITIITFFLFNFYIVSAWDIWDYGGTGGRAMIQSYPILIFCVASIFEFVSKRLVLKAIFYLLILFCSYINIWWVHNAHHGSVQVLGMSNKYYWRVLGKWKVDEEYKKFLDNKDVFFGTPKKLSLIYENNFELDSFHKQQNIKHPSGNIFLDENIKSTEEFFIPFKIKENKWLRVSGDFQCFTDEWDDWRMAEFKVTFYFKKNILKVNGIKVSRFIHAGDITKTLYLDARIPTQNVDEISVSMINPNGNQKITLDNIKVFAFKE